MMALTGHGQQSPQFTQFTELNSYVNPAAVGGSGGFIVGLAARHQWLGLTDPAGRAVGPQSYLLYADIPFLTIRSGLGFVAMYDKLGPEETVFFRIQGAHHLKPGRSNTISLGFSADYVYKSFDVSQLTPDNPFSGMNFSGNASGIDVGAGILYRHEGGSYLGVSAHNLLQTPMQFAGFNYTYLRQFQLLAGTSIPLVSSRNLDLKLMPAFLIQSAQHLIPQYNIQAGLLFNDRVYAALTYRYEDAIGAVIGFHAGNIRVGISYDYTTSMLREAGSYGSPELVITYSGLHEKRPRWQDFCY